MRTNKFFDTIVIRIAVVRIILLRLIDKCCQLRMENSRRLLYLVAFSSLRIVPSSKASTFLGSTMQLVSMRPQMLWRSRYLSFVLRFFSWGGEAPFLLGTISTSWRTGKPPEDLLSARQCEHFLNLNRFQNQGRPYAKESLRYQRIPILHSMQKEENESALRTSEVGNDGCENTWRNLYSLVRFIGSDWGLIISCLLPNRSNNSSILVSTRLQIYSLNAGKTCVTSRY